MLHSAWLRWGALLGAILLLLLLSLSTEPPQAAVGAPGFAPTSIVDDQSPNNMSVNIMVGQVATPGAAGTPGVYAPLAASSSGALSNSVQGRVGATTPVASVNPVLIGVQDYSNNLQPLHVSVPATGDNSGDARLQASAFVQGQSTGGNTMVNIKADPTTNRLYTDVSGSVGGFTLHPSMNPTLTVASSYVTGDYVGTSATPWSWTACRTATGTGQLQTVTLVDKASQSVSAELWLFDRSVTVPNDSAAWTITDADAQFLLGVVPISTYYASGANSVAAVTGVGMTIWCNASSTIYGALVVRGAPSWASGDVTVTLGIAAD